MPRPLLILLCTLATAIFAQAGTPVCISATGEKPVYMSSLDELVFKIEDAKCHIGIASVNLTVSELRPEDGNLVGEYSIQVPLMKSKNDAGRIVLPLRTSVSELGEHGGVLYGKAYSHKNDTSPNNIVCEIRPFENKAVHLAITTENRIVNFQSRYIVINTGKDS